ncbi:PEP-utilizing enzyme [Gordonia terrae]
MSRVLVTGGTGAAGATTVKWLLRFGAKPVVLARRQPGHPLPGVEYIQGDIQDFDAVAEAVRGCDAVAHFAWTVSAIQGGEKADAIDIGGTTNLMRAMLDNDCRRIVFASSITVYGAQSNDDRRLDEYDELSPAPSFHYERNKVKAENMLLESGLEAVNVRPGVIVGRSAWSAPAQIFRQPVVVTPGRDVRMQLIHVDDVGRFFAKASLGGPTGPVNLVADDALSFTEIGRLMGRPVLNCGERFATIAAELVGRAPAADSVPDLIDLFLHYPIGDTRRLREEFGFECAYSTADSVTDMRDWSSSQLTLGLKSFRKPRRLADAVVFPRQVTDAAGDCVRIVPKEYTGEFDNVTADPSLPEWSAANLSEAFPGPMTPLSLELAMRIMFSAANLVTKLFPVDENLAGKVSSKQVASIGHRLYNNLTVMRLLAAQIPGQTPESFDQQMNGIPLPAGYTPPKMSTREALTALRAVTIAGPQLAGLGVEVAEVERRVEASIAERPDFITVSDEKLFARIEELMDLVVHAWDVACVNTFLVGVPMTVLTKRYGDKAADAVRAGTQNLRSAALLHGVRGLAEDVRSDARLRDILTAEARQEVLGTLRAERPDFHRRFQALLDECGHRGPGETELSNPMYADSPDLLMRAITSNLRSGDVAQPKPLTSRFGRALVDVAVKSMERRERCRDATVKLTHELRQTVREWGRRLHAAGAIADPSDVHYLPMAELYLPPADAKERIARRRAERKRLRELSFPVQFEQPWEPPSAEQDAPDVERVLNGIAVSPGVVRGRVRIMREPDDELEPGEVLVASVTDTGWTPFFGSAAAVVTDIGGAMSHAAIVAREFGIPAIVNTKTATQLFTDGQLVEVDGTAGTIRAVQDATVAAAG